ncbi:amino acid ABC transporter substrate-binding protein [Geodermatophilus sabuli]|uniref:Amino acid ABC transporter substrate-binding protein n=1 Tax=Geodermatophilus sabuli TaxID=1564158 RepID=A0A7K3VWT1_9ACTN|nr:ABC transporter substrate-binding protein [Geodermatophilus sabuli]NEK57101.1 amino acid ABC transporter substrate-binding protein [Geodermatophilus sabuli]
MRNTARRGAGLRRRRLMAVSLTGLAVLAAGCRGGGEDPADGGDGGGDVATDVGVTSEPCPDAVNADNGCIYLGTLSDLTVGPFAAAGPLIIEGQEAFWNRVNEDGGIGGYDVDVTEYVRDNQYNPQVTNQVYQEIKPDVLALAQTLGSPMTAAIVDDLDAEDIIAAPAAWSSLYLFQDVIVESGASYCAEAMNGVDYAVENDGIQSVMAIHYAGDYGADAAAGAKVAAEANGIEFTNVETTAGADNQAAAIAAIREQAPDLVLISTGPTETATIVGQAVAGGFQGRVMGSSPTWNPAILQSPAAPAFQAAFQHLGPWGPWDAETDGHAAALEALGDVQPNEFYLAGWFWSYPLKAALEAAAENGDLTRAGLREAAEGLEEIDFEGVLPEGTGNYAGGANEAASRATYISAIDPAASTGLAPVAEAYTGPTVEAYEFTGPCYEVEDLG